MKELNITLKQQGFAIDGDADLMLMAAKLQQGQQQLSDPFGGRLDLLKHQDCYVTEMVLKGYYRGEEFVVNIKNEKLPPNIDAKNKLKKHRENKTKGAE